MIKEVDVTQIESDLFNGITNLAKAHKQIKTELNRQLGVELKKIPYGQVILLMEYGNKFMTISDGTMADMKEWIKGHNDKNYKLVIDANTWTLRIN